MAMAVVVGGSMTHTQLLGINGTPFEPSFLRGPAITYQ